MTAPTNWQEFHRPKRSAASPTWPGWWRAFERIIFTAFLLWASALSAQSGPAQGPVPVAVQPLSEVLVTLERSAPAEVVSLNRTVLSAQVPAPVLRVHADAGQQVAGGDLLVELDPTDYQLAVQQAEASLASVRAQEQQADARLKRARDLVTNQYISADDLLARETDLNVLKAQIRVSESQLSVARNNLSKCRIVAPFTGVVRQREGQVGEYVVTGSPLVELTQTDRYELESTIPDEFADSLGQADTAHFRVRGKSYDVKILRLSDVVDTQSRTRLARLAFVGEAPPIGSSGELLWTVERGMLPSTLLVRREGQLGIFLARDGIARFAPIPAAQEGRPVALELSGSLDPDAQVVTRGRERLQDGDPVVARSSG